MTSQPGPIQVPLLGISGKVNREAQAAGLPPGLRHVSEVDISTSQSLSKQEYALEMPSIIEESVEPGCSLGIFGPGKDIPAMNDIYALGLAGREPLICKVIKNDARRPDSSKRGESSKGISASRTKNRRKSFMTPTPLHIPESQISPIPDSTHEMIYLKCLGKNEAVKIVPIQDVVWMHPLILVMENPRK